MLPRCRSSFVNSTFLFRDTNTDNADLSVYSNQYYTVYTVSVTESSIQASRVGFQRRIFYIYRACAGFYPVLVLPSAAEQRAGRGARARGARTRGRGSRDYFPPFFNFHSVFRSEFAVRREYLRVHL